MPDPGDPQPPHQDLERALARIRETLGELEAARSGRPEPERPLEGPGDRTSATPKADVLVDWLRADLGARYFGASAERFVEPAPIAEAPRAPPPAALPEALASPVEIRHEEWGFARVEAKGEYEIGELLAFHDEAFLRNAYAALLRRDPDPAGVAHYLHALRTGEVDRFEILEELRFSPEGMAAGVVVRGLGGALRVRGWERRRFVGWFVRILRHVVRLPSTVRRVDALESGLAHKEAELAKRTDALARSVQRAAAALEAQQAASTAMLAAAVRQIEAAQAAATSFSRSLAERAGELQAICAALRSWSGSFGENLVGVHRSVLRLRASSASRAEVSRVTQQTLDALSALHRFGAALDDARKALERESGERVRALGEEVRERIAQAQQGLEASLQAVDGELRRRVAESRSASDAQVQALDGALRRRFAVSEGSTAKALEALGREIEALGTTKVPGYHLDASQHAFYAEFEDRFRGTREDIKGRVEVYIPIVKPVFEATGEAPVVDIGCGRGEWLEVLAESGITGRGVDSNAAMVKACRELGLDVSLGDGLEYLRGLEPASLGAVTAIHVIEHLPFSVLLALFDEARRVLKPGGVVIFETPNPENLIVGACNFWFDPTHFKPLPPEMIKHVAEAKGFADVQIMRLHPFPEWATMQRGPHERVRELLNSLLYGAQDYSVVAYRPASVAGATGESR